MYHLKVIEAHRLKMRLLTRPVLLVLKVTLDQWFLNFFRHGLLKMFLRLRGHPLCDKSVQFHNGEQKKGHRPICESKYLQFYDFSAKKGP